MLYMPVTAAQIPHIDDLLRLSARVLDQLVIKGRPAQRYLRSDGAAIEEDDLAHRNETDSDGPTKESILGVAERTRTADLLNTPPPARL